MVQLTGYNSPGNYHFINIKVYAGFLKVEKENGEMQVSKSRCV